MIPLFIWILCPADIVYLIKIDILGSRIKVMKNGVCVFSFGAIKGFVYCILHVCGGDPHLALTRYWVAQYSPRMWRWSHRSHKINLGFIVFSTYVEVIPIPSRISFRCLCILYVCGGDPMEWRKLSQGTVVFSTYVEVILKPIEKPKPKPGILHTCWECYCPWAHR